jgi:hypothetical protein
MVRVKIFFNKTALYALTIAVALYMAGCNYKPSVSHSVSKINMDNIKAGKKHLLRVAFVVDKDLLNYSWKTPDNVESYPVGRYIPNYYYEVLARHFDDVKIIQSGQPVPTELFDLIFKISVIKYEIFIAYKEAPPFRAFATHRDEIALNFSFYSINGKEVVSKKIEILNYLTWDDVKKYTYQGPYSHIGYVTLNAGPYLSADLIHESLLEFSKALDGSSFFSRQDFKDKPGFITALKDADNPLSVYLKNRLSADLRNILLSPEKTDSKSLKTTDEILYALITEMNKILEGETIYEPKRFAKVSLSEDVKKLIQQSPEGAERIRLNRLLLEQTYPQQIRKNDLSVYEALTNY